MTEYVIETFGIVQDLYEECGNSGTPCYQAIMNVMLTRSREEIVRCQDCTWSSSYRRRNPVTGEISDTVYKCSGHFLDPEGLTEVEPGDFCSRGERKGTE